MQTHRRGAGVQWAGPAAGTDMSERVVWVEIKAAALEHGPFPWRPK